MQSQGFEVRVAWQDRTLFCRYFAGLSSILVGGKGADIVLPMFSPATKYEVKFPFHLKDDEVARVRVHGGLLDLYFRPMRNVPRPLGVPLIDFSAGETTGVLLAMAVSLMLGLYMNIHAPRALVDEGAMSEDKIFKRIRIQFHKPRTPEAAPAAAPAPKSAPPRLRKSTPAKPDKPKALQTFGGAGLIDAIKKNLTNGSDLTQLAGRSTGRAGTSQGHGQEGRELLETGSGRDGKTIGAGLGPGGRGNGRQGVLAVGGLGGKGSSPIQVSEQGASEVTGMDREAIRRVIREHLREIRSCYERELQASPDLHGKVVLEWDIGEGGQVLNAHVGNDSSGNPKIGQCLVSRLKTWRFPDPPKDQIGRVVYPFIFSAR